MSRIVIDEARCTACVICGRVCPRYVLETGEREGRTRTWVVDERVPVCIDCGHCMAACEQGAIRVEGIAADTLRPLEPVDCAPRQLLSLLAHRRSVRRYKKKPVERALLEQVIEAVRWAPSVGAEPLGVIVVDRAERLAELSRQVHGLYEKLERGLASPIGRFFIRRRMGAHTYDQVRDFVMPGMRWYLRWQREGRSDEIFRDCPALLLFHAATTTPSGDECCVIAAWHAVLAAEALGLGTCVNGLIPPGCNHSPEARALLGLPEGREVYASVTLGHPKYRFHATLKRPLEARFLE